MSTCHVYVGFLHCTCDYFSGLCMFSCNLLWVMWLVLRGDLLYFKQGCMPITAAASA